MTSEDSLDSEGVKEPRRELEERIVVELTIRKGESRVCGGVKFFFCMNHFFSSPVAL